MAGVGGLPEGDFGRRDQVDILNKRKKTFVSDVV
jgi:hypothetical protein